MNLQFAMLFQLVVTGFVIGSFYALMACGYTVFYGTIRLINFAHAGVFMLGAFIGYALLVAVNPIGGAITAVGVSMAGTVAAAGIIGLVIRWFFALVQTKRRGFALSPMIFGVGVGLIIENTALHLWGSSPRAFPVSLPEDYRKIVITLIVCVSLLVGTELWVHKTRFGAAMRAVGIDHGAVRLMGISVERVVYIVFMFFSGIAGITGYLAGAYYGSIQFLMGFVIGLKGFTACVLGGIGNVRGALVGGWTLGLIEALGGGWLGTEWTDVIAFSVLILVLVVKPTGILGENIVERM
jgi:branched-chain amino acid transport system permease protein